MDKIVTTYVLPALFGLLGGLVGSLIAPWVHWGVERRRTRQAKRRELVSSCRVLLNTDIDKKTFRETEVYAKLRRHLHRRVIKAVEQDETADDSRQGPAEFRKQVLEEVARIEKKWVLI